MQAPIARRLLLPEPVRRLVDDSLLTVDDSNSVKFKTTFVGEYTTYLTLTERVNTFVMILRNEI